jgi:hypothetical protein
MTERGTVRTSACDCTVVYCVCVFVCVCVCVCVDSFIAAVATFAASPSASSPSSSFATAAGSPASEADNVAELEMAHGEGSFALAHVTAAAVLVQQAMQARGEHSDWTPEMWTRFVSRQKQIELGKETVEYQRLVIFTRSNRHVKLPQEPVNDLQNSKRACVQRSHGLVMERDRLWKGEGSGKHMDLVMRQ